MKCGVEVMFGREAVHNMYVFYGCLWSFYSALITWLYKYYVPGHEWERYWGNSWNEGNVGDRSRNGRKTLGK